MASINAINNTVSNANFTVPNGTITAGTGLTVTTGDANIAAGTVKVVTTASSSSGVYYIGSIPFVHNYGTRNTFVGNSGNFTNTGNDNVGIGQSMLSLTSGGANTGCGQGALQPLTTGAYNACFGYGAAGNMQSGGGNCVIGYALASASSGDHNVAIGFGAIFGKAAPTGIIAIGRDCLGSQPADYSIGIGYQAFYNTSSSTPSTGIGSQTLQNVTSGGYNTALGYQSGISLSGTDSSNILIASNGTAGDNNTIRIGAQGSGSQQQNLCYIAGITGVTVTGSAVLCATDGKLGTVVSSQRYKENINDIPDYDLLKLRPVSFNYIADEIKIDHYGFIAEEVQESNPELVLYNADGQPDSIKYHEMPALLLNEIQKLNKRILELEAKLA